MHGLLQDLRRDLETNCQTLQVKFDDFRNSSVAERKKMTMAMEEERTAVRTAHDEHMRCLGLEHDARVREANDTRADLAKGLADNRRLHQEGRAQLQSLIELQSQKHGEHIEKEREERGQELQNLNASLIKHILMVQDNERNARKTQFEELVNNVNMLSDEHDQKFDAHRQMYQTIADSHQQLRSVQNELSDKHTELAYAHSNYQFQQTVLSNDQLSLLESERNSYAQRMQAMDDAHREEIARLSCNIQNLEASCAADRERHKTKHEEVGQKADMKHKEMDQTLEARLSVWEARLARLAGLEPYVQANAQNAQKLDAAVKEFSKSLSITTDRLSEVEKRLERNYTEMEEANKQNTCSLKEEFSGRCKSILETQAVLSQSIAQVHDRCNEWKAQLSEEYKNGSGQLDRAITARYEASVNNSSQQLNKALTGIKKEHDNALHELQVRIDELRTNLVHERNSHAKWMDEERAAFRKVHDEHLHMVEVERDARIRQGQEIRADLTKSIRADNETEGGRFFRSVSGIGSALGTSTPNSIGTATHMNTGTASLSGSKLGSMLSCLKQSRQGGDLNNPTSGEAKV